MAINEVAKELMWLRIILKEMNVNVKSPSILYVDNQSAIKITNGEIKLHWVSTAEQLADIFTKPLGGTIFTNLRDILMKNYKQ